MRTIMYIYIHKYCCMLTTFNFRHFSLPKTMQIEAIFVQIAHTDETMEEPFIIRKQVALDSKYVQGLFATL